ncbi:MAG: nucleotidyltransferase family protein [Cyanobacteria bacterium P01_D01_bin.71]
MKRQATIDLLQQHRSALDGFGVKSLAVFGSVARDEAQDSSDLDVLVEFEGKVTFDRYMDLKLYLEDLLGVSVDVVTKKMLRDEIQATVEQEAIRVA